MPHDIKNLGDTIPYPIDKEKIIRENKDIKSLNINKHVVHKSISTKPPTKIIPKPISKLPTKPIPKPIKPIPKSTGRSVIKGNLKPITKSVQPKRTKPPQPTKSTKPAKPAKPAKSAKPAISPKIKTYNKLLMNDILINHGTYEKKSRPPSVANYLESPKINNHENKLSPKKYSPDIIVTPPIKTAKELLEAAGKYKPTQSLVSPSTKKITKPPLYPTKQTQKIILEKSYITLFVNQKKTNTYRYNSIKQDKDNPNNITVDIKIPENSDIIKFITVMIFDKYDDINLTIDTDLDFYQSLFYTEVIKSHRYKEAWHIIRIKYTEKEWIVKFLYFLLNAPPIIPIMIDDQ